MIETLTLEFGHARATAVGSAEAYIESQCRNDNLSLEMRWTINSHNRRELMVATGPSH
jgi:hypothetical protein